MRQDHRFALVSSLVWLAVCLGGCGSGDDGKTGGAAASGNEPGDGGGTGGEGGLGDPGVGGQAGVENGKGFDESNPGIRLEFSVGSATAIGQDACFLVGTVWPSVREDFDAPSKSGEVPLETCQVEGPNVPSCSGQQDCAAEQQCIPRTNQDGAAIADTEHCETPRARLKVGPISVTGFVSGPKTLVYNAGKNGAYTTMGGDGSIQCPELGFGVNYTLEGQGAEEVGLGPFSGVVRMGPRMELTRPAMINLPMGVPGIEASVSKDLVLEWTGSDAGVEVSISLSGNPLAGGGSTIVCRTLDKGTFTIPAAMVQAANLGAMAMANMLEIRRVVRGSASGSGMTSHNVETMQLVAIQVAKRP